MVNCGTVLPASPLQLKSCRECACSLRSTTEASFGIAREAQAVDTDYSLTRRGLIGVRLALQA